MDHDIPPREARAALDAIDHARLRVVEEIGVPGWYWIGLAVGWVALGVVTDLSRPWLTFVATLAFGTAHAWVAPRVITGQHRTGQLSVDARLAGHRTRWLVIGALIGLAGVTVGGALVADADGAGHPVTFASILVAVMILFGGPQLLALIRRKARTTPLA
jgi:hypothetical protein